MDYIDSLHKVDQAQLLEVFGQIEKNGLKAKQVRFRQIEGKLWEMKIWSYRVFYVLLSQSEMIVLHAYKKQGQKLPLKEKELALKRMKEVLL